MQWLKVAAGQIQTRSKECFIKTEIINHWKHLSSLVVYSSITGNFQIKTGLVFRQKCSLFQARVNAGSSACAWYSLGYKLLKRWIE